MNISATGTTASELANVKLTTISGQSCGGYFVFVKICQQSTKNCCEEQIVKNGKIGFDGSDDILNELKKCSAFMASHITDILEADLAGWNEIDVKQNHKQN